MFIRLSQGFLPLIGDCDSFATSETFCFFVGPEQKKFLMHSSLVAKMSKPFDAMINGSMKEAREGSA